MPKRPSERFENYAADRYHQIAVAYPFERRIAAASFAIEPEDLGKTARETSDENRDGLSLSVEKRRQDLDVRVTPRRMAERGGSAGVPVSAIGTMAIDASGKAANSSWSDAHVSAQAPRLASDDTLTRAICMFGNLHTMSEGKPANFSQMPGPTSLPGRRRSTRRAGAATCWHRSCGKPGASAAKPSCSRVPDERM
jgi:hypothetical protein